MTKAQQETGKGDREGTSGPFIDSKAGDDPFGMAAWMRELPSVSLHPLMQHPATAFAAATAIGLGMTGHVAGLMLGAIRGMAETAQKSAMMERTKAEPCADVASNIPVAHAAVIAKRGAAAKGSVRRALAQAVPVKSASGVAEKPKRQKLADAGERQTDDLKRISGIGPKLEQVLNGMGIRRYADVALWSDKDVTRFDDQLGFGGRIARDGWVSQAKTLMKS